MAEQVINTAGSNSNNTPVIDNAAIIDGIENPNATPNPPAQPDVKDLYDASGNLVDDKGTILKTKDVIETEKAAANQPKFDSLGNQVDATGTIIKTKEQIDLENKVPEIKLDANGNQVNEDGTIIKTKEQLATEAITNDDSLSVPAIVSKLSGYEPVDENGEVIVYGDSYEELARRDVDIVNQFGAQIAQENEIQFYQAFPVAHEVNSLIIKHNVQSVDDLVKLLDTFKGDSSVLDIEKATEPQLIDKVVQARMAKGDTKEEAERFAAYSKADGKLKDDAKTSDEYLIKSRQDRISAQETARLANEHAEQEKIDAHWNNVASVLNAGKLGDYTIPENIKVDNKIYTRQDFFNYLMKPVKDNYSQDQLDESSEAIESKLFRSYLRFTKGDMSQLVKLKVQEAKVADVRSKLSKHNAPSNTPSNSSTTPVSNNQIVSGL